MHQRHNCKLIGCYTPHKIDCLSPSLPHCRVRLMVKKEGQFFTVEDRGLKREEGSQEEEEDIRYKPRARSIQHVKSVLGKPGTKEGEGGA